MLEEGQSGSTAFLSVAGQSRERGGASVLMILLLLNYYQLATTTAIVFTAFLPARWTGYEEDRNVAWVGGSQGNGGIVLCVIFLPSSTCPYRRDGQQCAAGRDLIMYGPDQRTGDWDDWKKLKLPGPHGSLI